VASPGRGRDDGTGACEGLILRGSHSYVTDAKAIVVAAYRQVLENPPELCGSESEVEYSDHGEALEGMLRKQGRAGGLATV
jgi:hypothetical protein